MGLWPVSDDRTDEEDGTDVGTDVEIVGMVITCRAPTGNFDALSPLESSKVVRAQATLVGATSASLAGPEGAA